MAAAKSGFPNSAKLPPVKGRKDHAGKSSLPNQPHQPQVKAGSKTGFPNSGSGPKQKGNVLPSAPSVKAPVSGPSGSNVMPKVGGILGRLAVGKVGR